MEIRRAYIKSSRLKSILRRLLKGIWEMFTNIINILAIFILDIISIYDGDEEFLGKRKKRISPPGPFVSRFPKIVSITFEV